MKRILVVYYSRTGRTRQLAEAIAHGLDADIDELRERRDRSGAWGYLRSLADSAAGRGGELVGAYRDPRDYDLVVIGSPVWAGWPASPLRSYLRARKGTFRDVALFVTLGGTSSYRPLRRMSVLAGMPPVETLAVREHQVINGDYVRCAAEFAHRIRRALGLPWGAQLRPELPPAHVP